MAKDFDNLKSMTATGVGILAGTDLGGRWLGRAELDGLLAWARAGAKAAEMQAGAGALGSAEVGAGKGVPGGGLGC